MRLFPLFRAILRDALDADGKKIVNLATPTQDADAANKAYVDSKDGGSPEWENIKNKPTSFPPSAHSHESDSWFTAAINAVKSLIPSLPSWLTPSREEPPTQAAVAAKYTKPSGGIPATDMTQAVQTLLALVPNAEKQTSWDNKQDAISGLTAALVSWLSQFKGSDTATTLASVLAAIVGKLDKQAPNDVPARIDWEGKLLNVYWSGGGEEEVVLSIDAQGQINFAGGPSNLTFRGGGDTENLGYYLNSLQGQISNKADQTDVDAKANRAAIAPEYSSSSAYTVGQYVFHGGSIYRCTTAIALPGEAWTPAHWSDDQKLDDFFKDSNTLLIGTIKANAVGEDEKTQTVFDELARMDAFTSTSTESDSFDIAITKLSQLLGENVAA